jgi:tellurite resistance protein
MVLSTAYETLARAGMLAPEEQVALARVEPLAEVMFLMMAADGTVADAEREVLRGAVRSLSDDGVRAGTVKVMLEKFQHELDEVGREARLEELCDTLRDDRPSAEGAFVLAAAIAFADGEVADSENDLINELATRLSIEEPRANELLDTLQDD